MNKRLTLAANHCLSELRCDFLTSVGITYTVFRISVVLDKPYRDKSWHTPNKFLVTFFFIIIVQNMALEVELKAFNSINTSKLKNTRSRLALLI